jgi:hypothetical protein
MQDEIHTWVVLASETVAHELHFVAVAEQWLVFV